MNHELQVVQPAIVEERESTVVLVPGARARGDAHGTLIVEFRLADREPEPGGHS